MLVLALLILGFGCDDVEADAPSSGAEDTAAAQSMPDYVQPMSTVPQLVVPAPNPSLESLVSDAGQPSLEAGEDSGAPRAECAEVECGPRVIAVRAGGIHTCVLREDGSVVCWGRGNFGELGYGDEDEVGDDEDPADVGPVNFGGSATQLALGFSSTCVLMETGAVRCWGSGNRGTLGYGHEVRIGDDEVPATAGVVDIGGRVQRLVSGYSRTCVILAEGELRCWGDGSDGSLGYGTLDNVGDDETPASVGDVPVGGKVVDVALGSTHTCALLDSGSVRCWGTGPDFELGYGHVDVIGDDEVPESVGFVDVGGTVVQLVAGMNHTCALLVNGAVRCWGAGLFGVLGHGNTETIGNDETPSSAGDVPLGGRVVQLTAGGTHNCAIMEEGSVRCWGIGVGGRLGYGNKMYVGDDETPASAGDVELGERVMEIAAGDAHTCALLVSGAVRCWGDGGLGRLGYGDTEDVGDDEHPAERSPVRLPR